MYPIMAVVKIENASILQGKEIILSDINFEVEAGEFVYLVGKTGSGKSSLLKVLYGELPLEEGEGEVCGYDLDELAPKDIPFLRRKLGVIFQDFQLLSDRSVYDNLKFVLQATGWKNKTEIEQRIDAVLDLCNISNKKHKFPHEISGGEQQCVAIARALLNEPLLIVADEPTGNLDSETSSDIIRILKKVSESGTAVLMATHDRYVLEEFPSRVLLCSEGKLIK